MTVPLWKVAVEAPLNEPLTYLTPPHLLNHPDLIRGASVRVPLGKRHTQGIVIGPAQEAGIYKLKEIAEILDTRPPLQENFMQWLEWLSRYYLHPIGAVTEMAFPPLKKGTSLRQKSRKTSVTPRLEQTPPPTLTDEQVQVIGSIQESAGGFGVHLLHGVTGSGKTEVYIRLLQSLIQNGQQALVLVPEISLTPQLTQRFARRLGDAVAVIHSHLTPREKTDQWWAMVNGDKQILIGARSALFCPVRKLGMIIIDEEHESSFKQDDKLKYHARDAAVMLAKFSNCPVVLGSATPSLESWNNVLNKRYQLHEMKSRVEHRPMPAIEIVDLRKEREARKESEAKKNGSCDLPFWMSQTLFDGVKETFAEGKQSALFLNRRGVAQSVVCPACGFVPDCPNCAVSLTLHGRTHLLCHYCDYHQTMGETCSDCHEGDMRPLGLGTEKIEQDLESIFPGVRIARMDRDEVTTRQDLEAIIADVEDGTVDMLVGTQMIAKGLDFPNLTLVGLVMADVAFNLPDFRAPERAFQLLTQVSGRSGRHNREKPGRVIIQTYNPDHPSIAFTIAHDYAGFARFEMNFREQLRYPPFWRLASLRLQALDLEKVQRTARLLQYRAEQLKATQPIFKDIEILGPAPCPLAKLRNHHRHQLLLKGPDAQLLGRFCRTVVGDQDWVPSAVRLLVDIDAFHLL